MTHQPTTDPAAAPARRCQAMAACGMGSRADVQGYHAATDPRLREAADLTISSPTKLPDPIKPRVER